MTDYEVRKVRTIQGDPNYFPFVKIVLALLVGVCAIVIPTLCMRKTESTPPVDRSIPKDAILLKEYDTHTTTKMKLWKLDGMCFVSHDLGGSSSAMTNVPCPTQEKEKP